MKKLLETLNGKKFDSPPIWMMRQAGRYLPEYREIRAGVGNFLDLCYNPKLASEITIQPIRRFGFDGAIIFSDILVIPDALGVNVRFAKGEGPILEKTLNEKDLSKLNINNVLKHLEPVFENISLTRSNLNNETTLIGFSGSPWTIATYMIEGGTSKKFEEVRRLAIENPIFFQKLIDILVESISIYLNKQIEAGAEVIKLFDSWSGVLPEFEFRKWVIEPHQRIVKNVRAKNPHTPIIIFTKGAGVLYEDFAIEVDCDSLAIDQNVSRKWANEILQKKHKKIIQGNLDNMLLSLDKEGVRRETLDILDKFNDFPFIFNLGHGILPHTPIENVEEVLKIVRNYKK